MIKIDNTETDIRYDTWINTKARAMTTIDDTPWVLAVYNIRELQPDILGECLWAITEKTWAQKL